MHFNTIFLLAAIVILSGCILWENFFDIMHIYMYYIVRDDWDPWPVISCNTSIHWAGSESIDNSLLADRWATGELCKDFLNVIISWAMLCEKVFNTFTKNIDSCQAPQSAQVDTGQTFRYFRIFCISKDHQQGIIDVTYIQPFPCTFLVNHYLETENYSDL